MNIGELNTTTNATNSLPDLGNTRHKDPVIFSNNSICFQCGKRIQDHDLIMAYKCSKASGENKC
jgi:hypothetical protein